jgi:ligand-binding SRPBCC domain-containing protein
MTHYTVTLELSCPVAELFAFLARPRNLVQLAPSDLHLELLAGPEVLECGSRLTWKGRRFGVSQHMLQEVTAFELDTRIVIEQKKGPCARWVHSLQFSETDNGVRLNEQIDFAPPSGLLGRLMGADVIRKDLDKAYAYREAKLREIFKKVPRTK